MLPFLKTFKKDLEKLENVSTDFRPPSHWYTTGNFGANRILSGSYFNGLPQGRVTIFAGPSDVGKSFLLSNVFRAAQSDGAFVLAIDTENALDYDYLKRVGVDVSPEKFLGVAVITIADVIAVVSDFVNVYQKEYGKYNSEAPRVLIAVDSLDMLLTESELKNAEGGKQTGDQGQRAKQLKAFLRTTVARIKALNISFIGTHQVYPADVLEGEGKWKINNAIRYSASQIVLITKLRLREGDEQIGIRMKLETFKSRFAKPGSKVEIMVPYDKGMSPTSGLIELLEHDGVIKSVSQGWYGVEFPGQPMRKFQKNAMTPEFAAELLAHPKIAEHKKQFEDLYLKPETPAEIGEADEALTSEQPPNE
jgi:recombination protein RecA